MDTYFPKVAKNIEETKQFMQEFKKHKNGNHNWSNDENINDLMLSEQAT